MGGWHLRMTWGQEVCYASLHCEPASTLGPLTVWSLWGNSGMARCQEMSTLSAGCIPQCKVTSLSSSGSLGFIVCVKSCKMVDSVPKWQLFLSSQYIHTICRSQIRWYFLRAGNILMARPGKFLESSSWWGLGEGKFITNTDWRPKLRVLPLLCWLNF